MMNKEYIKDFKTSELIPYAKNPRINDKAVDGVIKSIKRNGNIDPIEIDENNIILTGHSRLKAFNKMKIKTADVIRVTGLTEKQKKSYRVDHNKTNEAADWDFDLLQKDFTMEELEDMDFDMTAELAEDEGDVVEDEAPELKEKSPVKLGDIWILGKHRLMCGDSTDAGTVALLMNGEKADLMITDLPYGVSYGDKNKFLNNLDKGNRVQEEIKNDHIKPEELYEFAKQIYTSAYTIMKAKNSYYAFMPQGGEQMMMMMMALKDSGFQVKHELIWLKNNHVLGRSDYNYKHEPICYGWTDKGTHEFYAKDFKVSILEFNKPSSSKLHPTMKPIAILSELINNSSKKNHNIYDPTGGSGSTLIACEQLDRKCYMMELDEHYCDVIIRRWQNLTNQEAVREDGKTYSEVQQTMV